MSKKRVLIIEDESDLIMMVKMRLEATGYEVLSAADGQEGLERAAKDKPDLIILDLVMPKLDGYQACQRLKSEAPTQQIPVIILTASGKKDIEDKCLALGAEACMRKPFDSNILLAKIESLIKS